MPIVYLRHGEDDEEGARRIHDPHLTKKGRKEAEKVIRKITEKYGRPKFIFCSPFARARETLASAHLGGNAIYDPLLSKFFTHEEQRHPEILTETKKFGVKIRESHDDLNDRVKKIVKRMSRIQKRNKGDTILVITHGVIIKKIMNAYGNPIDRHINYLEKFVVKR